MVDFCETNKITYLLFKKTLYDNIKYDLNLNY